MSGRKERSRATRVDQYLTRSERRHAKRLREQALRDDSDSDNEVQVLPPRPKCHLLFRELNADDNNDGGQADSESDGNVDRSTLPIANNGLNQTVEGSLEHQELDNDGSDHVENAVSEENTTNSDAKQSVSGDSTFSDSELTKQEAVS